MKIPDWANPNEWSDEAREAARNTAIAAAIFVMAVLKGKGVKELAQTELKKLIR